ncbi:MAG TPA: hypothetical protein VLX64_03715 [Thermoplasmata archaeon]|nr:hypothetical protein [Thermoplasmata archaeon]HUJ78096.1 hypothetical protein [Thermoplasmata archaeon]
MVARRTWLTLVLAVAAVETLLLVAQYFLGLWTAAYAPAAFTSDSSFPSLDWHYTVGFTLFFVGILLVALAALSRDLRLIGGAIVVVVSVLVAGNLGAAFVSSTPNDAADAFGMGVLFLVAFVASMGVVMTAARGRRHAEMAAARALAATPSG